MAELFEFLVNYGYIVVFLWVLLDQAGLPLPALPLLFAAGALAGTGDLNVWLLLATCVVASVPIDMFWYWLGRVRGMRVLHLLCILSLEPDYCVRTTENTFQRLGPFSVLVAKFVPGLQTLAPPMSGLTGMNVWLFLVLNTIGTLVWAGLVLSLGVLFHGQVEAIAAYALEFGQIAGAMFAAIVVAYFGWKLYVRQQFVRSLRMSRIEPEDLHNRLKQGEALHVIDLRHDYDFAALPELIPGAIRVPMEAIERHKNRIPLDSDIVLCCS